MNQFSQNDAQMKFEVNNLQRYRMKNVMHMMH